MNADRLSPAGKQEYRVAIVVSYLVAVGMLICLAFAVIQLSHRLFPDWKNEYLLVTSGLVALEAMLAVRTVRDYAVLTPDWLIHRAVEWVVLLVLLKALLYLVNDPAQILVDVLEWDEQFFTSFFTPEYAAVVLFSLFIWLLAVQFGNFFLDLEASLDELELESQGMVVKDRTHMRRSLEAVIFGIGILMMVMMAFTHADIKIFSPTRVTQRVSVLVLLLYFFLGFILLAQSQFFIQRARWYLQQVPASPGIGRRWALYSLLLISVIAALVSLLPTGYSAGLFQWLQLAVGFLLGLITYLFLLIMSPFLYLIQLLASLIRPGIQLQPMPAIPPMPPPAYSGEPDLIWLLIKSLLFWTIFFSVIFFSFRFYVQQHPSAWEKFKQRPGIHWFVGLITWLRKRFRRLRRQVDSAVETGVENLRAAARASIRLPRISRLAGWLPPRLQILLLYREMLRWNTRNGLPRLHTQTPAVYSEMIAAVLPAARPEIEAITTYFIEARYTRHEIEAADAEQVRESWRRLKHDLAAHLNRHES